MRTIEINDKNLIKIVTEALKNGELVIFPTETSYGVGVDATNTEAVTKLLHYKKRPEGKAISVAVPNQTYAEVYVELNSAAENIYRNFLPGPITVISKSKHKVDARLEAENGSLGIRIPNYKIILDILSEFRKPITATSANSAGDKTPYSISDILDNLSAKQKDLIGLIIDAGELPHNPPSTVIDTTSEELTIHRQGRIDPTKIKSVETVIVNSEAETIQFAEKFTNKIIAEQQNQPILILLNGEMGAGKTHFTKGIAKALGISQVIKSPTYTYVNEYKIPLSPFAKGGVARRQGILYHFDAWRIQSKSDLEALRFHDWFKDSNVIVVEWPTVVMNLDEDIFKNISYIYIDFINLSEDKRELRIYSF